MLSFCKKKKLLCIINIHSLIFTHLLTRHIYTHVSYCTFSSGNTLWKKLSIFWELTVPCSTLSTSSTNCAEEKSTITAFITQSPRIKMTTTTHSLQQHQIVMLGFTATDHSYEEKATHAVKQSHMNHSVPSFTELPENLSSSSTWLTTFESLTLLSQRSFSLSVSLGVVCRFLEQLR